MIDSIELLNNFVLCRDVTEKETEATYPSFVVQNEDTTMRDDNLRIFQVVKVSSEANQNNMLHLQPGDKVISIALGMDAVIDEEKFKVFDQQFIVAKL